MNNRDVVDKAFEDFEKKMLKKIKERIVKWCGDLVSKAVEMRLGDPKAHNFTGNLINSIFVCLYENGNPTDIWYASEQPNVRPAIRVKMTARNRPYFFQNGDYDGSNSKFRAEVPTNQGWGIDDAKAFYSSYRPQGNNEFDIVVGYAVEYADFVQQKRKTTGYLEMIGYTRHSGMTFMQLKAA